MIFSSINTYNILEVESLSLSLVFINYTYPPTKVYPRSIQSLPIQMSPNSTTLDISIKDLSGLEKLVGQSNFFQWKYEMECFFRYLWIYGNIRRGYCLSPTNPVGFQNGRNYHLDRMITFVLLCTIVFLRCMHPMLEKARIDIWYRPDENGRKGQRLKSKWEKPLAD
jgi:hypothetical protein